MCSDHSPQKFPADYLTKLGKGKRSKAACSSGHISAVCWQTHFPPSNCTRTRRSFTKERNPACIKGLKLSLHVLQSDKEKKKRCHCSSAMTFSLPGFDYTLGSEAAALTVLPHAQGAQHNEQQVTHLGDVRGQGEEPPVLRLKLRLHLSPRIWIIFKGKELLLSGLL